MDPNAALAELRQLVAEHNELADYDSATLVRCDRMCELIEALDNWVMAGGFLPIEWLTAQGLETRLANATTVAPPSY